MTAGRKPGPHDPTAQRTADQSTQTAGGLHQGIEGVPPGPGPEVPREAEAEDVLNRNDEDLYETPRRYEQDERDPALPTSDATLKTNI